MTLLCRHLSPKPPKAQEVVNWVTTADGCVHNSTAESRRRRRCVLGFSINIYQHVAQLACMSYVKVNRLRQDLNWAKDQLQLLTSRLSTNVSGFVILMSAVDLLCLCRVFSINNCCCDLR